MKNTAWAKTGDGQRRLLLTDHSIDVAAVAEALLRVPGINRRLAALACTAPLGEVAIQRLGFLIGLHDAGKVVHGFQARLHGQKPDCGHIGPLWDMLGGSHTEVGGEIRPQVKEGLSWQAGQGWFEPYDPDPNLEPTPAEEVHGWSWQAILTHHGSLPREAGSPRTEQWLPRTGYAPLEALASLTAVMKAMFPAALGESVDKLSGSPRFLHALAGLVTLADWLGSDQTVFRFPGEEPGIPTGAARIPWARQQAAALVARRGLDPNGWQVAARAQTASFAALFPGPWSPRPAQAHMLAQTLPAPGQIATLEAETGSGKTEAALAHFFRLFQAGEVDGLFRAADPRRRRADSTAGERNGTALVRPGRPAG